MKVFNYGKLLTNEQINSLLELSEPITDIYIFQTKEQVRSHYMNKLEFLKAIYYYYFEDNNVGGIFCSYKIKKPEILIFEYNLYVCKDLSDVRLLVANALFHEIKHSYQYKNLGNKMKKDNLNCEKEAFQYSIDLINNNKDKIEKILGCKFKYIDVDMNDIKKFYK